MFSFLPRPKMETLQFFMRSGNSFVIDNVTDWNCKYRGDTIVELSITQHCPRSKLLVQSVALGQIEAIVRLEK